MNLIKKEKEIKTEQKPFGHINPCFTNNFHDIEAGLFEVY